MISIIIPLHNLGSKGDYCLKKCLDSIIAQTYADFEVLLMENGSTDDTVDVAKKYCEKDSRFKLHVLDTIGVSNARNKGIDLSSGEYITFIDGDDFISDDYLQSASSFFNFIDIDIIFLPWSFYYQHNHKMKNNLSFNSNEISVRSNKDNKNLTKYVWAKVFKNNIIKNKIYFDKNMIVGEDSIFMTEAYFNAHKVAFSKHGTYFYSQNRNGQTTNNLSYTKMTNLFKLIDKYENIYLKYNVFDDNKDIIELLTIVLFVGKNFAQSSLAKLSLLDINKFIHTNRDFILQMNVNDFHCKKWQKVWFRRFQKAVKLKSAYGAIFIKFMRIYRNIFIQPFKIKWYK